MSRIELTKNKEVSIVRFVGIIVEGILDVMLPPFLNPLIFNNEDEIEYDFMIIYIKLKYLIEIIFHTILKIIITTISIFR